VTKNYIVLKNLSICSDGSVIIVAGYVTFLKKFEKVRIFEKDFKSFQNIDHKQQSSYFFF